MAVSHTKAKFENFPSSGIKRVPGAKNMRKNRRKQVDERNLLCYNHQCRRICGCSSMARIPAFQAGRVGSIPITRSRGCTPGMSRRSAWWALLGLSAFTSSACTAILCSLFLTDPLLRGMRIPSGCLINCGPKDAPKDAPIAQLDRATAF